MNEAPFNLLTSSNFELAFPVIPSETTLAATEGLSLNTYGVIIPGITLDQGEMRWQGAKTQIPEGTITFEPLSTNFIVDSNLSNWKVLFNWLIYIHNNYDSFIHQYEDYVVDSSLKMMSNYGDTSISLAFKSMWIQSLSEVTLSQREGEMTMECAATFVYDRYTVT